MRRNHVLAIGLTAVVAASASGWLAGRQIRSPAEIAARTAPPKSSLISVAVEKRALASDVVTRGTVRFGSPQAVSLPKSALKVGTSIITSAPTKGAPLNDGSLALTVSGRPVLVLRGAQPAYRDLGLGAQGVDVQQLEDGLARLGFNPGRRDGVYDGATAAAVAGWYAKAGWQPFGASAEQLAGLKTAEGDLFTVESDRLTAMEATDTAHATQATAAASVVKATAAVDAATASLRAAEHQRDAANRADPPPSESERAANDSNVTQARGALDLANADRNAANTEVANAANAVTRAEAKVALVARRVDALAKAVADLGAKLGIQVPAGEVLFFGDLPVRVDDVKVKTGEEPVGAFMTVSNSQLAVDGALAVGDAKLVHNGAAVTIDAADLKVHLTGSVTEVADTPGTRGVDPQRFYLQVTPTDAPISLAGASVVMTITVGATEGEVLAVPVSALSVAADGTTRVQVVVSKGKTRDVTVTPGLAAKGLVAVAPVAGALQAGDLVVVGQSGKRTAQATNPTAATTTTGPQSASTTGGP
jgi:hypothetical protein